jgi:hypothetical protein
MHMGREPHIGEYVAKTNAICDCSQIPAALESGQPQQLSDAGAVLLPLVSQYLIAGSADLGAMLLKAGQDTEVALIYHRTAVALNVAGTGLLLIRRAALILSDGTRGNRYRQQRDCEKKLVHRVPSFDRRKSRSPIAQGINKRDRLSDCAPRTAAANPRALVNAAELTSALSRIAGPTRRLN